MKDEVLLAAILLAAAGVLLILTLILLCIVFKFVKTKSSSTEEKTSEIPKTTHHYDNSAFQRDASIPGGYENAHSNNTQVNYYGNDSNDQHKAEWPTSYNMYAVSRSYAFPKAGDHSEQGSELGSRAHPSNPPSTVASRSSFLGSSEVHDKSFSEEVFEGINHRDTNSTPAPSLPESSIQQENDTRVWKSRTPSESVSLHSHETSSVHGSTVSHGRDYRVLTEQRSYYSSFKPQNVSVSTESLHSQVADVPKNSGSSRERIATHSIKTSGTRKVFTFDIK